MSHGLKNAQKEQRPDRCTRVFVPRTQTGKLNYRRTCLCGKKPGHAPPCVCPDCGGAWGKREIPAEEVA